MIFLLYKLAPKYVEKNNKFDGRVSGNIKTIWSLDESDENYWICDTGNSENVFSEHYDDMTELYRNGQYLKVTRDFS